MELILNNKKYINKQKIEIAAYSVLYYGGLLVITTLMLVGITFLCFG